MTCFQDYKNLFTQYLQHCLKQSFLHCVYIRGPVVDLVLGGLQYLFLVYFYSFLEGLRNSNHSRLLDTSHNLDNGSRITDSNTFTFTSLFLKSLVRLLSQWPSPYLMIIGSNKGMG